MERRGSSMPMRFAYWWRVPPPASAVGPGQTASRSRTRTRAGGRPGAGAMGVLVADAAAGQRGRAGADRVELQHDDTAVFPPREVVGGGGAHDPRPDDDRVRGLGHGARIIAPE